MSKNKQATQSVYDIIQDLNEIATANVPSKEELFYDLKKSGLCIRAFAGDVQNFEFIDQSFTWHLWKISKVEAIIENAFPNLPENDKSKVISYIETNKINSIPPKTVFRKDNEGGQSEVCLEIFKSDSEYVLN